MAATTQRIGYPAILLPVPHSLYQALGIHCPYL